MIEPSGGLRVDVEGAWDHLLGRPLVVGPFDGAPHAAIDRSLAAGDLIGARAHAVAALHALHLGARVTSDERFLVASLWERLGSLDMELGAPLVSLGAAHRALELHRTLKHPAGQAHASESGLGPRAERLLRGAQSAAEAHGDGPWTAMWAVRRAENEVLNGDLDRAEKHLDLAHAVAARVQTTVPQDAARQRITAAFMLAAGRLDEARRWALDAKRIGVAKGMANQVRLMAPIIDRLGLDP